MRRVTHEKYISQSQWVNCDLARRYVGLKLSQHPPVRRPRDSRGRRRHGKDKRLGSWKNYFVVTDIHDLVSKGEEARRAQRLCKEVSQVLVRTHKRNDDSTQFYHPG